MAIPKRISERLISGLKQMIPVLQSQKARDVSEADTVTLVKDLLADVFGYDKYAELTSEHAVRGTFCDLAITLDSKVRMLIEVKAIGGTLKDNHTKQAIDYAANEGIEWVALTNGQHWILYNVIFKKPIDKQEVCSIDLFALDPKSECDQECLFLFSKEGMARGALGEYRDRKDATSRFMLAAIILNSEPVLAAIRREVKKVSELNIDAETIATALREQVIKRDALDGEQADAAAKRFNRTVDRPSKPKAAEAAPAAAPTP